MSFTPEKLAELKAKMATKTPIVVQVAQSTQPVKDLPNELDKTSIEPSVSSSSGGNNSDSIDTGTCVTPMVESTDKSVVSASTINSVPAAPSMIRIDDSRQLPMDHLEFLSKMEQLQSALLTAHPTMPVLLMQIHKQLSNDPEIVTLLTEDAIGIIVQGLQKQTKTELISVVVKQSKAKDKKTALTTDLF